MQVERPKDRAKRKRIGAPHLWPVVRGEREFVAEPLLRAFEQRLEESIRMRLHRRPSRRAPSSSRTVTARASGRKTRTAR